MMIPGKYLVGCFIVLLTAANALDQAILKPPEKGKYCVMERVQRMLGYSCSQLNLKEVPQYLKSSLEILDLSFNRIRDLDKAGLSRYSDVKYLYLFENMIQTIEVGTFSMLTRLEALDLSDNALTTVPLEIFHLPSLRNLYVAHNNLFHFEDNILDLRTPIKAPIQIMSFASCKLHSVPNLGILPELFHLNLSSNPMSNAEPIDFSRFCSLKSVDLNRTRMAPCQCQNLRRYLHSRAIVTKNGLTTCDMGIDCPVDHLSSNDTVEFYNCIASRQMRIMDEKATSSWLIVAASVTAFIITIMILACICHKRRRRRLERKRRKQKSTAQELIKLDETNDLVNNYPEKKESTVTVVQA